MGGAFGTILELSSLGCFVGAGTELLRDDGFRAVSADAAQRQVGAQYGDNQSRRKP